jgi:hypothetical protein
MQARVAVKTVSSDYCVNMSETQTLEAVKGRRVCPAAAEQREKLGEAPSVSARYD